MKNKFLFLSSLSVLCVPSFAAAEPVLELEGRRELFVDRHLIAAMRGTQLVPHPPRDEGQVLRFDLPWEGEFCGYCTILREGDRFRAYYRGKSAATADGSGEVLCVAESKDGRAWSKPRLGLVEVAGTRENNVLLQAAGFAHNFSPLLDTNPAANPAEKYKALAGTAATGLAAFVSADGLRWTKLQEAPVISKEAVLATGPYVNMFDSQNVAFWSEVEQRYVAFFRVTPKGMRRIARAESADFRHWTHITLMEYRDADGAPAPLEHLYTNQTHPYFRAPHLYLSIAARFMPGRRVLSDEQAEAIHVHPKYFKDTSDAVLMTTRGGNFYDRTFLGAFIRPGIGAQNWVSRTTYPALNVVQTGPAEMSVYVNQDYAQPTAHLRRYSLRLDGFASLHAPYEGGEMITKPLTFQGARLLLNFATSAAGGLLVEVQEENGQPIPGFTLGESIETIGNEIERAVLWKKGGDVSSLADRPVRLRFVLKDADLFSFRFAEPAANAARPAAK